MRREPPVLHLRSVVTDKGLSLDIVLREIPHRKRSGPEFMEIAVRSDGVRVADGLACLDGPSEGSIRQIFVEEGFRRLGIATCIYDFVESVIGRLHPSSELDETGALFWEARIDATVKPRQLPTATSQVHGLRL